MVDVGYYGGKDVVDKTSVAQQFYAAWLKLSGVDDPLARVKWHPTLGYVGVVGQERAKSEKRAYDILPPELLVEINRYAAGLSPLDAALVERILSQNGAEPHQASK